MKITGKALHNNVYRMPFCGYKQCLYLFFSTSRKNHILIRKFFGKTNNYFTHGFKSAGHAVFDTVNIYYPKFPLNIACYRINSILTRSLDTV